jgi:hypothetical protein
MADDRLTKLADLEKRMTSLETKYSIAVGITVVVAAIFGISGAWGAKLLSDAYKQIGDLRTSVSKTADDFTKAKETAIAEVKNSARAALKQEASNQLGLLVSRSEIAWKDISEDAGNFSLDCEYKIKFDDDRATHFGPMAVIADGASADRLFASWGEGDFGDRQDLRFIYVNSSDKTKAFYLQHTDWLLPVQTFERCPK